MQIRLYPILLALLAGACFTACGGDHPPDSTASVAEGGADSSEGSIRRLLDQYDPPGRDIWQKPEVVIGKMGDLQNKVVADIGAGSGFFSRRLAQQAKKVIAVEVDERFVQFMDSIKRVELKPEYQSRLEVRLASPTDSKLRGGEADIILIVNTYIYLEDRIAYLKHLLELLPAGGKVIIVDFKRKRIPISYPPADIRLELFQVENELEEAGFVNFESDDCSLDYQYIIVAEKRT
jgi:SAM-dependent methyltransferase